MQILRFKIDTKGLDDETWEAWIDEFEVKANGDTEVDAFRGAQVAGLIALADRLNQGQYPDFETVEFSLCIHEPVKLPIGWIHCYRCGKSVAFDDSMRKRY